MPAHWLAAAGADADRVLLFLHGGGYQLGSLRSDGELAARLGRASGMRVLFPEYRLAPEHPFPAASATSWPHGVAPRRPGPERNSIAVAGDSAGGGLAVALRVATRDAGESLPAAAVLMSPTVDLTGSEASMTDAPATIRSRPRPCLVSSPPTIWPGPTLRRLWRRRCSPHCPAPAAAYTGRHRRPAAQRF